MKRLIRIGIALGVTLATTEGALHLFPRLLPRAYLARFPGNGCEFFHPGVLGRTPVEGVLLPHLASAYDGPPPADMVELGVAPPAAADADRRDFPRIELPSNALGLADASDGGRSDLLLVGDSFGVAAAALRPEGLQVALAHATGLVVHNLSLAGLGPIQENWLLETHGLATRDAADLPRAVLWLYFSGNDLTASYEPLLARRDGKRTWAEAWPERAKPALILPDLLTARLGRRAAPPRPEPLPGFAFRRADGSTSPVWFQPDYLRQLGWSRDEWEAHPVWAPVRDVLRSARDACEGRGVRFLLVYLPSKAEALLPSVVPDPELARRTIGQLGNPAPAASDEALWAALLAGRHAQEELMRDFCARESIPFLSALPALEAQAARGELGYLVADTHWHVRGQAELLEPLLEFLRGQGLLP